MIKKRINLAQVNYSQGPKELNAYYLPYSTGVVWSYANSRPLVASNWELGDIAWRRNTIDDVYKDLADCDAIGISCYIWNKNYSYELARKIKSYNPNCLIIFGGPEPAIENLDFFTQNPFIDVMIKKEGEIAFADLLERTSIADAHDVPGLMINHNGVIFDTGTAKRINDLDNIPSPYTTGIFDRIVQDNPNFKWNMTLETNRGCPYQCTFCDWGSLTYNKVKKFNLERVFAEIAWSGANQCDFMSITDANFGMFVERDEMIVDHILAVQDQYQFPRRIGLSWAKNQKVEVVKLAKKFTAKGFNNGLTLSVQSLDDKVLTNIKRRNLEMNRLGEVFDLCAKEGLTVNTELILGLPGETITSWERNVWELLEINQHSGIEFFQAQLITNAEMNLSQRETNKMTSITVYDYMSGTDSYDEIAEGVEIVTSTCDLDSADMQQCQLFQWFINTWHINGITQWYSRFLRQYAGIQYEEFYAGFRDYLSHEHSWYQVERSMVQSAYQSWMEQGTIAVEPVAGVRIHGWNLIHLSNLRMHAYAKYEQFHAAAESYVKLTYGHLLNHQLLQDLSALSRAFVIRHIDIDQYPVELALSHNLVEYITAAAELHTSEFRYDVIFAEDTNMALAVFMQNIYYQRRRNFGKARFVAKNQMIN